jgi:H+/Cl- antiporter ClcA
MTKYRFLKYFTDQPLQNLQISLSRPEAMIQLTVLGMFAGMLSGAVIIVFRISIESLQSNILPWAMVENYDSLPIAWRFGLPIIGALLIALIFMPFTKQERQVGVAHVLERLAYHQGRLSLRGLLLQFAGAGIAIVSGHSVGREGPSIHLGAASSSLIGQHLGLPNNALRTLVACGCTAAIAASFNTPLAGVIFALEVIMQEYTLASFMPVILSAVSATAVSRIFYGAEPAFSVPQLELASLIELPYMLLMGIVIGSASALLISLTRHSAERGRKIPFWLRLLIAAVLTGLCAAAYPQIMGIGYDTVNQALLGELGVKLLIGIIILKTVCTAGTIGLGVPAGIIGPTLFIGAAIGALHGITAQYLYNDHSSHSGLYALLGMGAMMGATLQAPLAALTAVLELTYNPNIILPGMLVIVIAALISSQIFGQHSIFTILMHTRGLSYHQDPMLQAMRRIGVASVMNRRFKRHDRLIGRRDTEALMSKHPDWIIIDQAGKPVALMPAFDLALYLQESTGSIIDLLNIPAKRLQITSVSLQASVDEALECLAESQTDAIYVERITAPGIHRIHGIVTKETLESSYRI